MPTLQSSFNDKVFSALPGQYASAYEPRRVSSAFARGLLRAGLMAFQVPSFGTAGSRNSADPGEAYQIPSPGVAAAAAGIGSGITSAAGTKTIGSGITAGASAAIELQPARQLTVTFDASTDWDPTVAVITYVNNLNQTVSENLAIATSTTATTVGFAKSFVSLVIPAQTGGAGTATLGYAALAALTANSFLGIVVRQPVKSMVNPTNLYIGPTSDGITNANTLAHYVDGDTVTFLQTGGIWVYSEEDMLTRQEVYVRVAAGAGGSLLGAFRNDADGGSCVLLSGARVVRDTVAGTGVTWIHTPNV